MIKSIIDYLVEVKGLSKIKALMIVLVSQFTFATGTIATATWQVAKYVAIQDSAYADLVELKSQFKEFTENYAIDSERSEKRTIALKNYIFEFSRTYENASNNSALIQLEAMKQAPNIALIKYIETQRNEEQKKLPHNNMQRDSIMWQPVIGHRLQQKRK